MVTARTVRVWISLGIATVVAALGMSYMQHRFESSDRRNATEIVRGYDAGRGRTIEQIVRSRHPDGRFAWDSRVHQGCLGHVRVRCRAAGEREDETVEYRWDVDMGRIGIHPANAAARAILLELDSPRRGDES